jgi:hypothetical protein
MYDIGLTLAIIILIQGLKKAVDLCESPTLQSKIHKAWLR